MMNFFRAVSDQLSAF